MLLYCRFSTVVRDVCYNKDTDDFTVSVKDLVKDEVIVHILIKGGYRGPHPLSL